MELIINCVLMAAATLFWTLGIMRSVAILIFAYLAFVVIPGMWGTLVCAIICLCARSIVQFANRRSEVRA